MSFPDTFFKTETNPYSIILCEKVDEKVPCQYGDQ